MLGRALGQYKVEAELGSGVMGVVYRATDTRLGRPVAIKVLPDELTNDPERRARFVREARTLAALNDSRIAAIYGYEEDAGIRFLALEYVPGPTLAERLRRGALPVREAMLVLKQIAEALEAAHAEGIIHRDLKPANIKVNENGQVKVLDFGLAKAMERPRVGGSADGNATVSENLIGATTIVGTPAYMSPEEASGKELDARTDIWSFGCVLYEALTGKQAFRGPTVTEVLAAVLEREPDWAALPANTSTRLALLVKRCLRKDANSRMRDIGDGRIELEDLLAAPAQDEIVRQPQAVTRRTAINALSGAAAGAAATGVFAISRWRGGVLRNLTRFAITPPEPGSFVPSFNPRLAISPDGTRIAFNANGPGGGDFYMRSLADLALRPVKGAVVASFSPDGRWLGLMSVGPSSWIVQKVDLSGGAPVKLSATDLFYGATWADNDILYWADDPSGGLVGIATAGGQLNQVAKIDFAKGERHYKYPCALPEGKAVLVTLTNEDTTTFDEAQIVAVSPANGQKRVLIEGGTYPRYSQTGHLLYAHDGKVMAVGFDPSRLEVHGQPFTVLEGVQMSRNTGAANFDISASGELAYIGGICDGGTRTLVWVDRNGNAEPVPLAAKSYLHPRLSPDDRRLAIEVEGPSHDLYVYDFDRGVLANITTNGVSHWPIWSPDGRELAYRSGPMVHMTIWRVPADRSQKPQQVPAIGGSQNAESWSPDGRTIAYTAAGLGVVPNIMVTHPDGGRPAESFSREKAPEGSPKFSPDGGWLAYCSNESGKPQVYVQAFPGPGAKIQISNSGGTDPVWKRSGGELYYRNGDSMMAVVVSMDPTFQAGRPQELWKGHYSHGMSSSCGPPGATSSNYDVTADGKRFLMVKDDDQDRATSKQIIVVLGWAEELRRLQNARGNQV